MKKMKNEEFATTMCGHKNLFNMETRLLNIRKRSMNMTVKLLGAAFFILHTSFFVSCSDMLDTESTRQNFDPSLDEKTDSLFYVFGIFEAMQRLADQYVLQGEMRGDLVKTTEYTDNNLRQLANFTATTTNKYDSAYVYYRVINNCNYYIANRNTDLYTGAENVAIREYAGVKALRAWAYLQLVRNYGKVPFFTEPLTKISQIDSNNFPELDIYGIVAQLAPDLQQYSRYSTPQVLSGGGTTSAGSTNWSLTKNYKPALCFIPVSVVLGDLYLEAGDYPNAAKYFVEYFTRVANSTTSFYEASMKSKNSSDRRDMADDPELPTSQMQILISESGAAGWKTPASWEGIFSSNSTDDIISYIPMAVSSQNGPTTNLPLIFGADYYATPDEASGLRRTGGGRLSLIKEIQLLPSDALNTLSDSTEFYYYVDYGPSANYDSIAYTKAGDMRLRNVIDQQAVDEKDLVWIKKYDYANIILYRNSTVLLHLAEAFNRMGMYDAAFAILKDGISDALINTGTADEVPYMTDASRAYLKTELLKDSFLTKFPAKTAIGIHCHGVGKAASDMAKTIYRPGKSPYTLDRMVGKKMQEVAQQFGVAVGTTRQDTINAIEDMLCDEYALEFAFEGNRYFDLMRLARHKNADATYGANFGGRWLRKKLEANNPAVDLSVEQNWYLPFK
jgi:hypothetical protein